MLGGSDAFHFIHFMLLVFFYTLWKYLKTSGFLMLSEGNVKCIMPTDIYF